MMLLLFLKLLEEDEFLTFLKIQRDLKLLDEETNKKIMDSLLKKFLDQQEQMSQELREQFLKEVLEYIELVKAKEDKSHFNTLNKNTIVRG